MKLNVRNRLSGIFQSRKQRPMSVILSGLQRGLEEGPITKLPKEVLLRIFFFLRREPQSPRCVNPSRNDDIFHASLVCKAWNNLAMHVYYEVVQLRTVASVFRFHQTLQKYPHIRTIVRVLIFPARLGWTCPEPLMDAFAGILDLLDNVKDLKVTCRLESISLKGKGETEQVHVLPVAEGRHPELKRLTIYSNGYTAARFPATLTTSFLQLTSLSLNGIFLSHPVSADTTPALPELSHFTAISGNVTTHMDDWLVTCPKLRKLSICGRQPISFSLHSSDIPMSVLARGKIQSLTVYQLDLAYTGTWLAMCDSVTRLYATWEVFSHGKTDTLPPSLRRLTLNVYMRDKLSLEPFQQYLSSKPTFRVLEIILSEPHPWVEENKDLLKALCATASITLSTVDRSSYMDHGDAPALSPKLKGVFKSGTNKELWSWEMAKT